MNNKYSLPKDGGLIAESTPRDIIHRYEKIHTTVYENEYLGVQYVADTIVKAIRTYNELHCSNESPVWMDFRSLKINSFPRNRYTK